MRTGIDPFVLQLLIIPLIVIGIGLLAAYFTKKIILGVISSLIANVLAELIFFTGGISSSLLSPYNIIFPVITLVILLFFIDWFKSQKK